MSKNRSNSRKIFVDSATDLIVEVYSGKWEGLEFSKIPIDNWDQAIQEYESRCPGHTRKEYIDSLRRAQWNYR